MRTFLIVSILAAAPVSLVHAQAPATTPIALTLSEAEQRALDGHPQIRAGHYAALAATESVREARAPYFPVAVASFTGAGAIDLLQHVGAAGVDVLHSRVRGQHRALHQV